MDTVTPIIHAERAVRIGYPLAAQPNLFSGVTAA